MPETATGLPGRRSRLGAALSAAGVVVALLTGPVLAVPALPLVVVLLPIGVLAGLVGRIALTVRRRRAATWPSPADPVRVHAAAVLGMRLRSVDRRFSKALLLLAGVGVALDGAFFALSGVLSAHGFVSNDTSVLGDAMLALGALSADPLLVAVAAIPVSIVIVTLQIRDRDGLIGEARALADGGAAGKRIRSARTLGTASFVVWELLGIAAIVAVPLLL